MMVSHVLAGRKRDCAKGLWEVEASAEISLVDARRHLSLTAIPRGYKKPRAAGFLPAMTQGTIRGIDSGIPGILGTSVSSGNRIKER